jgi:surface carbohydrate biosynthesis protein (TIGR04326 family)
LAEIPRDGVITVWDSGNPCGERGDVYCWNGYEEPSGALSLLRYVEVNGEPLRLKYLAWIHDLGESQIGEKRVIDHMALACGLSYWWLTLFVEQSPWKSPCITDALRLLALDEILQAKRPRKLRLVSANRQLQKALRTLCGNLGVPYEWQPLPRKRLWRQSIREIYRALPHRVQALVSFVRYLHSRWPLRRTDKSGFFAGDRAILLCSYFIHLDQSSCSNGDFHSRQWEELPQLLHASGYSTNWIQHYLQSSVVPNSLIARNWVSRFNQQRQEQGFHVFLDAYLSWRIVFRVMKAWVSLIRVSAQLHGIDRSFQPRESSCSFWPIMKRDWRASLGGPAAISNLLWVELFDAALRDLPRQNTGLYLCENQAWERAFIHSWRKHKHGRLIAVPHSTVRFWDLRYFKDVRTIRSVATHSLPKPDLVALNGPAAVDSYLSVDYPREAIVECEALRYGYIERMRKSPSRTAVTVDGIRVLILGDYFQSSTINLLQVLEAASARMHAHVNYTIKPHPNYQVNAQDYPSLQLNIVNSPLRLILSDFDIACSCNATSAAVDAFLTGLPVIVMLDSTELNFSPLRGRSGVRFVATAEELAEALRQYSRYTPNPVAQQDMFFVDPKFPRWTRLLDLRAMDTSMIVNERNGLREFL